MAQDASELGETVALDDADNEYGAMVHDHYEADFDGYRGAVIEALESIDECEAVEQIDKAEVGRAKDNGTETPA